jgi:hypothetical protein
LVGESDELLEQSAMSDQGMGTMKAVRLFLGWRNCQTPSFLPDHPIKDVTMRQLLIIAAVGLIPATGYAQGADYFRFQDDLRRSEADMQQRMYGREQWQREQLIRDQQRERERELEQMRRRGEEMLRSRRSFDYLGR